MVRIYIPVLVLVKILIPVFNQFCVLRSFMNKKCNLWFSIEILT